MTTDLKISLWLLMPLIISGIAHMIIVKKNYLSFLAIPLHTQWFGANKTWRGFFILPLLTILGMILAYPLKPNMLAINFPKDIILLGCYLGIAYMLFELPNSFLKRRLGVEPGKTAQKYKHFFIWLDHTDSSLGCILVYSCYLDISLFQSLLFYLLGIMIHFAINYLLYLVKIRKNPL